MSDLVDLLKAEFEHEAETTRKQLERLPEDKLEWRPHEKSFTAGGLASHIVDCIGWGDSIFNSDEYNIDPATYIFYEAKSVSDLLSTFDDRAAKSKQALARVDEVALVRPWKFKIRDKVRFERPKVVVFRDFTLNHLIHHRGQFTVYLRLLNVPVPGSYGPTADET